MPRRSECGWRGSGSGEIPIHNYDAILIPGGGVRESGALPSWVRRRLDRALELQRGEYLVTLSAGTPHRPPPLGDNKFPIFESAAAARYLIEAGIPSSRVLMETSSWDTIGNAFFSRVIHVQPRGWRRVLVIASDFHLERVQAAFNWTYGLTPNPIECELHYEAVPDPEMDPALLRARIRKEREAIDELARLTIRIRTMQDFHRWLFTEHRAYSGSATPFRDTPTTPDFHDSY